MPSHPAMRAFSEKKAERSFCKLEAKSRYIDRDKTRTFFKTRTKRSSHFFCMSSEKQSKKPPRLSARAHRLLGTVESRAQTSPAARVMHLQEQVEDKQSTLMEYCGASPASMQRARDAISAGREIGRPGRPPVISDDIKKRLYQTLRARLEKGESFDVDDVVKLV